MGEESVDTNVIKRRCITQPGGGPSSDHHKIAFVAWRAQQQQQSHRIPALLLDSRHEPRNWIGRCGCSWCDGGTVAS